MIKYGTMLVRAVFWCSFTAKDLTESKQPRLCLLRHVSPYLLLNTKCSWLWSAIALILQEGIKLVGFITVYHWAFYSGTVSCGRFLSLLLIYRLRVLLFFGWSCLWSCLWRLLWLDLILLLWGFPRFPDHTSDAFSYLEEIIAEFHGIVSSNRYYFSSPFV